MCNKIKYDSKSDAMKEARQFSTNRARGVGARHLRAYECHRCGYYHLTSTSKTAHRTKMRSFKGARV